MTGPAKTPAPAQPARPLRPADPRLARLLAEMLALSAILPAATLPLAPPYDQVAEAPAAPLSDLG